MNLAQYKAYLVQGLQRSNGLDLTSAILSYSSHRKTLPGNFYAEGYEADHAGV